MFPCTLLQIHSLCQILQSYQALQMQYLYQEEWHGCCSGFVVSNTSFKQLFTSIQVAKLSDTLKIFSWWNVRMIVHFFCSNQFTFFQFMVKKHLISIVNSLLKLKCISLLIFQKLSMIILCSKKWKFDFLKTRKHQTPQITWFSVVG